MEILDKHFINFSSDRKLFVISIGMGFFLIALISYMNTITNLMESFLIFAVGLIFGEMIKLEYRIQDLEKTKARTIKIRRRTVISKKKR